MAGSYRQNSGKGEDGPGDNDDTASGSGSVSKEEGWKKRSEGNYSGGGSVGEFNHDESPPFPPPEAMIHPSPMLRVNQKLRGVLMSTDGTSMIA